MNKFLANLIFFFQRKILLGFKIDKNAYVLDIGSGDKPFWRGDVFCDKLSCADNQRASRSETITTIGKFINSDVCQMPFSNKEFDFSYCSHLLEHVKDLKKAIDEINRVSKSGYIEVPNAAHEFASPFGSHLWLIFTDGKKLTFVRKSNRMERLIRINCKEMNYGKSKACNPFIRHFWKDSIKYEIWDDLKNDEKFYSIPEGHEQFISNKKHKTDHYMLLTAFLRKLFYKKKP